VGHIEPIGRLYVAGMPKVWQPWFVDIKFEYNSGIYILKLIIRAYLFSTITGHNLIYRKTTVLKVHRKHCHKIYKSGCLNIFNFHDGL
jgi:hypothetical protein